MTPPYLNNTGIPMFGVCSGPLVLHIAKLFPKNDCSSFDAYGRILSGTLRPGDEVRRTAVATSLVSHVWFDQISFVVRCPSNQIFLFVHGWMSCRQCNSVYVHLWH